jgi:hypothetical protein
LRASGELAGKEQSVEFAHIDIRVMRLLAW